MFIKGAGTERFRKRSLLSNGQNMNRNDRETEVDIIVSRDKV